MTKTKPQIKRKRTKRTKRKAREWWVTVDADDVIWDSFGSKKDALENIGLKQCCNMDFEGMKAIKVREVL